MADTSTELVAQVTREMLEPTDGFPSRLEWLAYWLDGMDKIIAEATGEPQGDIVQKDLRRWAQALREVRSA